MRLSPAIEVARKDLLSFFRSKSFLFWTLAFPLLMMLLFSSMFGGRGVMFHVAVVNEDSGELSRAFVNALNQTNVTGLIPSSSVDEARVLVERDKASAILIIPQGFSSNLTSGRSAHIILYTKEDPQVRNAITNMVMGFTESFSEEYRKRVFSTMLHHMPPVIQYGSGRNITREEFLTYLGALIRPIEVKAVSISRPEVTSETIAYWEEKGHWVTVMLIYSLIFSGMVGASSFLAHEKIFGAIKRFLTSPTSRWSLLVGKLLGGLAVLTLNQLILVALTILWLKPDVNWSALLIPVILAGDMASLSLGLVVVELSPDPKVADQAITTVGIIIQFISGIYFPIEILPEPVRAVAEEVPFTWALRAIDGLLIMGRGLDAIFAPVSYLVASAIVFTTLAVLLFPHWAMVD